MFARLSIGGFVNLSITEAGGSPLQFNVLASVEEEKKKERKPKEEKKKKERKMTTWETNERKEKEKI